MRVFFHGNLRGLLVSLNKALLGPYFLAGWPWGGVPLDCHDFFIFFPFPYDRP